MVANVLELEQQFIRRFLLWRICLDDGFANHELHQLRAILHLCNRLGRNVLAISHDGDVIPQCKNLIQSMGYIDNGNAFIAQSFYKRKQSVNFRFREGSGRLVHDDDVRFRGNRLGNFNDLLLGNAESGNPLLGVDAGFQIL
ncbi:hypothetical protein SDC9_137535 [bioreactor metagenome]|uniref:Uncharacterized protein n=1 Tax=bioreactor metagenome TaxID=1076179 RepID=A0A645DLT6_9ZZZZ